MGKKPPTRLSPSPQPSPKVSWEEFIDEVVSDLVREVTEDLKHDWGVQGWMGLRPRQQYLEILDRVLVLSQEILYNQERQGTWRIPEEELVGFLLSRMYQLRAALEAPPPNVRH